VDSIRNGKDTQHIPGIGFNAGGTICLNPNPPFLTDLDSIPLFPYELMPEYGYSSPIFGREFKCGYIMTSKGCPFPCKYYCPYPLGFGERTRFRSPVKVADEIQLLQEKCGIEGILFRDQVFTLSQLHTQQVCQEIIDRGIKIRWCCETRLDRVNQQLLELMKTAGCAQIHYGLESADPEMFSRIGKPGRKLAELDKVVSLTKNLGLKVHTHLIVGLPGESWKSIKNTARTLREWKPDSFFINSATPYPGTQFYADAQRNNWIQTADLSMYSSSQPVVRTEQMSLSDLVRAQKYIKNEFYGYTLYERLKSRVVNLWG